MTDEELDRARGEEAIRVLGRSSPGLAAYAARLAREGWMPVDEDLIAAREIAKSNSPACLRDELLRGVYDHSNLVLAALAGIKHGRKVAGGGS